MMAAAAAAGEGGQVTLLEKNEKLGKKLFITGKGRCNVTNAGDMDTLFANVVRNSKFLYSAFYTFDNQSLMDFLEKAGCRLKTERGDRVFPVTDHSSDVTGALSRELNKQKVAVKLHAEVKKVLVKTDGGEHSENPLLQVRGVQLSNGSILEADKVIVATGGISYQLTGSTGDGYLFARETGHKVVECVPSLVPFTVEQQWCRDLMGLALKNVAIRVMNGKKEIYQGMGEMLFTHFGVSGPLIISASSYYMEKKCKEARLLIDLKPALDSEQLDKRLLRDFEESLNKQFKNALGGLFPSRLIPVMIQLSGIDPDKKVNEITREERRRFGDLIKNLPLTVTGVRDFKEAIITKGGVSVKDVNPSTMESKKVTGLFFAGEVLDLDALTGGYNLQIAWSTGYLAGISSCSQCQEPSDNQ